MKILFVGTAKSGKTKAIEALFNRKRKGYTPTKGAEVYRYKTDNNKELYLWDTAGDNRYKEFGDSHYINTDICINFSSNKHLENIVKRVSPTAKMFEYRKIKNLKEFLNSI